FELRFEQSSNKNDVDLTDMRQAYHRMESADGHLRMGFFQCLPSGCLFGPFADLHESGRKRPETGFGFYRQAGQKHLYFPFRDAASDNFRIMIMNSLAGIADKPRQIVSNGNLPGDRLSTIAAVVHKYMQTFCSITSP